jgi:hypothetical protein
MAFPAAAGPDLEADLTRHAGRFLAQNATGIATAASAV